MSKAESKPTTSPEELLKAAVGGKAAAPEPASVEPSASPMARLRPHARLLGAAGMALALGTALGAGATALSGPSRSPGEAVAAMSAGLDAGRIETARLAGEVAQLHQTLSDLRASADAARREAAARGSAVTERVAQLDRGVTGRLAALGERIEAAEREHAALAAQPERKPAAAKPEPTQTGSLPEAKGAEPKAPDAKPAEIKSAEAKMPDAKMPEAKKAPADKPPVIDGWALRDIYDGAAILENRRRRIVEVGPGDTLPGVGRVEAVERRGREWVVVTRQGLVTAQPW